MRNRYFVILMMLSALLFIPLLANAGNYVPGEVLVKFKKGTSQKSANAANIKVQAVLKKKIKQADVSVFSLPKGISVEQAVQEYKNNSDVEYAQPNYIYKAADTTPDDTDFASQWGLHNTAQSIEYEEGLFTSGSVDADIDAPRAWDIETGSSNSVVIAVIDTGVKWHHEDLFDNIWNNAGESDCTANSDGTITGCNSQDDDGVNGNGYTDDVVGWDFVNGDNNPADDYGHGTHVAGIIAAVGDNAAGITGVMWTAKIMPLKALDDSGTGTSEQIASAIRYAADKGAHIINMSLGETLFCQGPTCDQVMRDAIAYAELANVLVVASAGNDSNDNDMIASFPASFALDNVISVAASDHNDELASFSNFGPTSVDLAAPGENILSTVPTTTDCSSDLCDDSGYAYLSGTSMAAPHVAGVAGLYLAKNGLSTPYATVKAAIIDNVNHFLSFSGKMVSGGRLNAAQTLLGAIVGPPAVTDLEVTDRSAETLTLGWTDVLSNTGYRIYRKTCNFTGSDEYIFIKLAGANDTSFIDTGLSPNSCYTYKIQAFNDTDVSDSSNEAHEITESSAGAPLRRQFDSRGSAGGGGCFIATAAYGSAFHPYVAALRNFRDKHLLSNSLGTGFVNLYYKYSPPIADFIRDSELLKAITRTALIQVVMFVVYPYSTLVIFSSILLSSIVFMVRIKKYRQTAREIQ